MWNRSQNEPNPIYLNHAGELARTEKKNELKWHKKKIPDHISVEYP